MKEIKICVYEYSELKGEAKQKARNYIWDKLLESELDFISDSWNYFCRNIKDGYLYSNSELPEWDCYHCDFKYYYKYHGARLGEYITKEFRKFLEKIENSLDFYDCDIEDYADSNDLLFYSNGEFYGYGDLNDYIA